MMKMERSPFLPLPEGMIIDQVQATETQLTVDVISTQREQQSVPGVVILQNRSIVTRHADGPRRPMCRAEGGTSALGTQVFLSATLMSVQDLHRADS